MPFSLWTTAWIFDWAQSPTWQLAGLLLLNLLWIPLIWWFLHELYGSWHEFISGFADAKRKFVVLAVDVPRDTEQTPVGMEAIFNQLEGAHGTFTWWEQHWVGNFQEWLAFEIVSIDGYVQYVVRVQKDLRDLVEASIYAQYPDAEITEIRDYVNDVPKEYPDKEWDFFATEYNLAKPDAYPIRVYREFEDKVRGELLDPMSALLEIMSKIGKGEQIWYQVLIKPIVDPDWAPEAQKVIDKIVEKKGKEEEDPLWKKAAMVPVKLIDFITAALFTGFAEDGDDGRKSDGPRTNVLMLTPGERAVVEEMERKLGKLAYKVRIRILYIAKKDVFSKQRGVAPVIGAVKQFNDATRNYFKVGKKTWTKANYALKKARVAFRQTRFMKAYADRSMSAGEAVDAYVLNTEELATIYHFPMASVKAPLLKRTGSRKSEPPASLPIDFGEGSMVAIPNRPEPPTETVAAVASADVASVQPVEPTPPATTPALPTATSVQYVDIPDDAPESLPVPDSEQPK